MKFDSFYKGTDWLQTSFSIEFHHDDNIGFTLLLVFHNIVHIHISDYNNNYI